MNKATKYTLGTITMIGLLYASIAYGATLQGFQGGTGLATSTAGNIGKALTVASTSPFLTYTLTTLTSGGSGTVTTSSIVSLNNFPFWATVGGGLSGTSTLSILGTLLQQLGDFVASGFVSSSQLFSPSGTIGFITFTSATGTNLTLSNNAIVSGLVSSTQLTVASGTINRITFSNATGTSINLSGQASLSSVSSTNLLATGYLKADSLIVTTVASTTELRANSSTITRMTFTNATGTTLTLTGVATMATTTVSTTLVVLQVTSSTELRANSSTIATKLQIPINTALTASGQLGISATTGTLNYFDGTYDALSPTSTKGLLIEAPTGARDDVFWIAPFSGKVTGAYVVNTNPGDTITFNLQWGQSRASTTAQGAKSAFTSNQTNTATTTISNFAITGSSTFQYGDVFRVITASASTTQSLVQMILQALP